MSDRLLIGRPPEDDDELWEYVYTMSGIAIPRHKVCPNHCAPFDAFADAYFARSVVAIWKASRGFGGKSTLLGLLTWIEAVTLAAQVTVLGGSAAQSQRVHDVTHELWFSPFAPIGLQDGDPTRFITRLKNRAWIIALMASQKSVRGPHPQRLRLDEIDEMDHEILEGAQGQPQEARGIESHTVMSSTHQYPDKTMTAMLKEAGNKGWPIFEWCWRESMGTDGDPGWLTQRMVERKKAEVSEMMWNVEYDLQEPSFEGRAIATEYVDMAFDPDLGEYPGDQDVEYVFEEPVEGINYVTGVDWAQSQDWTIIRTFRTDGPVWKEVAFQRTGRMPWPWMVSRVEARLKKYGGWLVHDATGLGTVIRDLLEWPRNRTEDFVMVGNKRTSAFVEYIAAIEQKELLSPRIDFAYQEHKYVIAADLFGSGHPPDSFVAGALAWSVRKKLMKGQLVKPASFTKESQWTMK